MIIPSYVEIDAPFAKHELSAELGRPFHWLKQLHSTQQLDVSRIRSKRLVQRGGH
jgi:hypothetical protein